MKHKELYEYLENNGWPRYSKKAVKMLEDRGHFEITAYGSLLDEEGAINKLGYKTTCAVRLVPSEDRFNYKTFVTVWAK